MMKKNILMGVMNITPNSFSDGDEYKNHSSTLEKLKSFLAFDSSVLDIGAESTAPFNDPVSFDEEWSRLDWFMNNYLDELTSFDTISIDTYKIQTIHAFLNKYEHKLNHIIWNDVSGDYQGALDTLKKYPEVSYVLSHNLSPKRELVSDHMSYLCEDILPEMIDFFKQGLSFFHQHALDSDRIYLDPCFGFSKTRNQNYEILKNFPAFSYLSNQWLLGVSRKSFLQNFSTKDDKQLRIGESETFHTIILSDLMSYNNGEMIFRVHDPEVFKKALKSQVFKFNS